MVDYERDAVHYFAVYNGAVMLYNNTLRLKDIETHTFTDLLSHEKALTVSDKYGNIHKRSIAMSLHEAAVAFVGGVKGKTVLDVGCKIGYFSFLMAEAGAETVGIEYMTLPTDVAKYLAKVRGLTMKCTFINNYIHTYLDESAETFDLALLFNVFDHILTNQMIAKKVIRQISTRCTAMVLMMGPSIPAPKQEDIPETILSLSDFTEYEMLLSHSYGDRTLWGFTKK